MCLESNHSSLKVFLFAYAWDKFVKNIKWVGSDLNSWFAQNSSEDWVGRERKFGLGGIFSRERWWQVLFLWKSA